MKKEKVHCVYCGDAQTNHLLHYINTSIDLVFSLCIPRIETSGSPFLHIERSPIIYFIGKGFEYVFEKAGIVRYSDTVQDAMTERTKVIWKEAQKRGIKMQQIFLFGKKREESRALVPSKKGSQKKTWEYFQSIPIPFWNTQPDNTWVDDKSIFKKKFLKHTLKVAQGYSVFTLQGALRAFRKIGGEAIVKPREGSRARHTTVRIGTQAEIASAFIRAKQLCPLVMIEEYIPGTLYRATCVNGKLIGVIEFVKPATIADGLKTVEELRIAHNTYKKFPNLTDVKDDAWFRDAISHQRFSTTSVPPKGTPLLLSEHSERPNGGYFIDITDSVPQTSKNEIERAAHVCEIAVIGFDIISTDLKDSSRPFTFIEGNSLPYIEIHHIPYEGSPRDVAGAVWDMWA